MASKYVRDRSQFYWIKTKIGAEPGKYRRFATRFKVGNSVDVRACNDEVRALTAQEWQIPRTTTIQSERWGAWVDQYLERRYRRSAKSLLRYQTAWRTVSLFLAEKQIETPRQLTRTHCFDYLTWRENPNKSKGKYAAQINTALYELRFLGLMMKEAVMRNFAPANPCRELGVDRDPPKKPSEFTDADLAEIEAAIQKEPPEKRVVLLTSYEIARCHGVRELETHFDPLGVIEDERGELFPVVDMQAEAIAFKQKGGRVRRKPMHPRVKPIFERLIAASARETFPMPKAFPREWHNFFRRHWKIAGDEDKENTKPALPSNPAKPCFHSFRVTVENKLRRARIPKELRMAYLSHETNDVNAGYDRFTLDELKACHAPLA